MGSATVQGQLWSRAAHDWAELQEPTALPLWQAILDAAAVGPSTLVLDAGCGVGGASVLAASRGAQVNGLDAAETLLASVTAASTSAQSPSHQPGTQAVATRYFTVLNAGMKNGAFSALASVYAPDAMLTQSNPKGVTTVVHGLAALTRFYQSVRVKFPGYQWATASWHSVAPTVVIFYEHAGTPSMRAPGRCVHTIVVQNGKITSIDWATYFAGVM